MLVPCYNEQQTLGPLVTRVQSLAADETSVDWEVLFVDDGSTDDTARILADLAGQDGRVAFLSFSRNFGKETAMLAGLDHVHGDATVILDADLQDPPELIPEMIHWWRQGYDDVYARRRSRAGETWMKKWSSHAYYSLLQHTTRIPIQRDTGDFRLLDRRCVEALRGLRESQRNTKALFSWIGYRKKELLFDRDARVAGETKWSYPKLVGLAIEGITSFTTAPLRAASVAGFVISALAIVYMVFIIVRTLLGYNDLAGYPSLIAIVLFLGGVQLLCLGVIGEYIGRIFIETKRRPGYLVQDWHPATSLSDRGSRDRPICGPRE